MSDVLNFQASCPKGLELLVADEAAQLGFAVGKESVGGVELQGSLDSAYRFCLWSRLANRLFLKLSQFSAGDAQALYAGVKAIDWTQHVAAGGSLLVDFSGTSKDIRNSHFGALRCKDAIVDRFAEAGLERPSVAKVSPDLRINVRLRKGEVVVAIDLSGDSLHRRGYRQEGGMAPLKENLAAAILVRAGWLGIASRGGALLDPMCGSGTFLIEGAMMSMNIAPGLGRRYWGFNGWRQHRADIWDAILEEAEQGRRRALARSYAPMLGYDANGKTAAIARQNISRAGLARHIEVSRQELSALSLPGQIENQGLLICNPPYGERLGDEAELVHLYRHLGGAMKSQFLHWQAGVFTGNPELGKRMGIRSHRQYQFLNGELPSKLLLFDIQPGAFVQQQAGKPRAADVEPVVLSAGAEMFANRLRKNIKRMAKWRRREGIECYRVYDADMPEYAVAIDDYQGRIHVSEYIAPTSISEDAALKRLREVIQACAQVFECAESDIAIKERRRQKEGKQYQRREQRNEFIEVTEGQATVLVNLRDFLDTGLFLDHRPVRLEIAKLAKGKRFLNLFCYTAVASVHAGLGGAMHTTSVDMSNTYLQWARKNLALNGLSDARHRTIQEDCFAWLASNDGEYDLILLDPPTFSNSKRMEGVLDTQRDHAQLINGAMARLAQDGLLIFSTNKRGFELDTSLAERYQIEDRCRWSIDEDFKGRSKPIHYCWFLRHK
ncbi:bifunctional 23S rRNA (guanine(2069)-N(7))-methyltransferase RlmK/23S rRNA (guanine(2445)-N(2))-methyltransferase RlmL [Spongiibacter taiwanensis]|uniref:bifunctional 23S rRNA (guanine(2069)-N(7))-methyltransferase RlmK/23S rRNA (guanine(2445)-N(2))-methyltransferase RlmL n=1 Tax=Spongiibacter taiwanensis TaxID=1748242 RepID=UPI002034E8FC|nr:bifunctional 23S rRNA (guanine(2069)-N(7))-methyltransferase RlmK/23S rRNA (guanine(2445)-N(2))-methyltransferase RlmL [Spongiibacter taiwanensis]USA43240.1 bifunctional 23S rRNA (guanine(2069)-N(7))-methyltransferase RlmK/23S rRNA (guanine(2445)-N(2))-methyltransferase RlmL [Spongiibacter taiwanensis]